MMATDEIVAEYKSLKGKAARMILTGEGYIYPYGVDEVHVGSDGESWYIITVFTPSLDKWLDEQCETNYLNCGHAAAHEKWDRYPRYNVHGSLLSFIELKWK